MNEVEIVWTILAAFLMAYAATALVVPLITKEGWSGIKDVVFHGWWPRLIASMMFALGATIWRLLP